MSRRKSERSLEFESLESMELLSGVGMAAPHAIAEHRLTHPRAVPGPAPDAALSLSGTVQGTYRSAGGGTVAAFTGRGSLSPAGKAQVSGKLAFSAAASDGQMTLSFGKRGKLFATIAGTTPAGAYTYDITGGTKRFAGDTGTGAAVVQILSSVGARPHGRFALILQAGPST